MLANRHHSFAFVLILVLATAPAFSMSTFLRSDFNGDGTLDIADPVRTLGYLFLGIGSPGCLDAGDSNDDGGVDLSDALYSLGFLFLGGSAPPAPYPDCGEDPTDDDLACDSPRCTETTPGIREILGDCGGVPTSEYPNSLRPGNGLHRARLQDSRAVCNDGSPAVFYLRPAPVDSPHADRWVIYLQGGGGCATFEDCARRWCSRGSNYDESKMSSRHTPESMGGTGIFSRGGDNAFGDFNQVYLYYCSSDSWMGRADDVVLSDPEDPDRRYSLNFRGHTIIEVALRELMGGGLTSDDREVVMPALEDAEIALICGFSAGSTGVVNNGDWMASLLERNGTSVRLVIDGAFTPAAENHPDPTRIDELADRLEIQTRAAWSDAYFIRDAFVDESAREYLLGTEDEWRLASKPYVVDNHLTTPFFVHVDLMEPGGRARYQEYGVDFLDYAAMLAKSLLDLESLPTQAIEGDEISVIPGAMGTLCGDHVSLMNDSVFFDRSVEDDLGIPRSYHDLLFHWLQGLPTNIVDDVNHPTTVCGPEQAQDE